jgi:RNA polymerase sigma factor (sigma-70 family)
VKEIASAQILEGIYRNDSRIVQYVYDKYFKTIRKFVRQFGGTEEDAWDVFQDAIIVIYEQVKDKDLKLKHTFLTYFYAICKNIWFKTLRDRDKKYYEQIEQSANLEQYTLSSYEGDLEEIIEKEKRIKLYQLNFVKLSKECQRMLKLVAKGFTVEEITNEFNYKSTGFTYKKRRICKERLIRLIKEESFEK